jgi:uncharacterized protein YkwD
MTAAPTVPTRRRPSRRRSVIIAAVVGCLMLAVSACTPESWACLDMINQSRAQAGRWPVEFHGDLWFKAQAWSDRLASDGYLHHSNLTDGVNHLPWRKLGENVGVGYSLGAVHNAFMGSTGHRNNILDPAFTQSAVGVTRDGYGRYWITQEFMQM